MSKLHTGLLSSSSPGRPRVFICPYRKFSQGMCRFWLLLLWDERSSSDPIASLFWGGGFAWTCLECDIYYTFRERVSGIGETLSIINNMKLTEKNRDNVWSDDCGKLLLLVLVHVGVVESSTRSITHTLWHLVQVHTSFQRH